MQTVSNTIVNYDGSITTYPRQLVFPQTVEEIQAVLKDPDKRMLNPYFASLLD